MLSAFLKLLEIAAKYGSKVVSFLKAAWGVISKYGTQAITWIKDNIGLIVDVISGLDYAYQFVDWLTEKLKEVFGW